jgi:hypothetical protein
MRELLQQALDALNIACQKYGDVGNIYTDWGKWDAATTALRNELAKPEQDHGFDRTASHMAGEYMDTKQQNVNTSKERVQKSDKNVHDEIKRLKGLAEYRLQLLLKMTEQKPWVGLTDEEIDEGIKEHWVTRQAFQSAAWWAESKLKEKNNA